MRRIFCLVCGLATVSASYVFIVTGFAVYFVSLHFNKWSLGILNFNWIISRVRVRRMVCLKKCDKIFTCYSHCHIIGCNLGSGSPDSKVHGTNMGPTWVLSAPDGPHIGPINLAIRVAFRHQRNDGIWHRCRQGRAKWPVLSGRWSAFLCIRATCSSFFFTSASIGSDMHWLVWLVPLKIIWINFNPSMDKFLHSLWR